MSNQSTNLEKLRASLQAGESLSNCRRALARFNNLLTKGIPSQGVTAQELIDIIGQKEADLIIAANAIFVTAEAEVAPSAQSSTEPAPEST